MERALQIFSNEALKMQIRAIEIEGEPWFIGKEVAEALGYKKPQNAIKDHVRANHKKTITKKQWQQMASNQENLKTELSCTDGLFNEIGGVQRLTIIDEAGLYSLILRSKLPQAEEFQDWVTSEVLPTLRKYTAFIPGLGQIRDFDDFIKKIIEHNKLYAFDDGFKAGYTQAFIELEQECQRQKSKNAQT